MERPELVKRRTIGGKEYSCKKLPYRQARPLQFRLAGALAPALSMATTDGDVNIMDALPKLIQGLDHNLIIDLCETCMVDGQRVNVDTFSSDEAVDVEVAALAVETHFVNFIKELRNAAGNLMPKVTATKS